MAERAVDLVVPARQVGGKSLEALAVGIGRELVPAPDEALDELVRDDGLVELEQRLPNGDEVEQFLLARWERRGHQDPAGELLGGKLEQRLFADRRIEERFYLATQNAKEPLAQVRLLPQGELVHPRKEEEVPREHALEARQDRFGNGVIFEIAAADEVLDHQLGKRLVGNLAHEDGAADDTGDSGFPEQMLFGPPNHRPDALVKRGDARRDAVNLYDRPFGRGVQRMLPRKVGSNELVEMGHGE